MTSPVGIALSPLSVFVIMDRVVILKKLFYRKYFLVVIDLEKYMFD